jgi:hypothetical protein
MCWSAISPFPQQLPMSWEISAAIPEELSNSPKTLLLFFNDCSYYPPGKSLQESQEDEAVSWRSLQVDTAIDLFPAHSYFLHPLHSLGGHSQVRCPLHPLPPPQHGCLTTWRHHLLPIVTAARGGGTCSQ